MTKRWLIALLIAELFGGKAFADCVPSPDTPAPVIEYFKSFNKPLPEQFCAKEDAAPQASEESPPRASASLRGHASANDCFSSALQCPLLPPILIFRTSMVQRLTYAVLFRLQSLSWLPRTE